MYKIQMPGGGYATLDIHPNKCPHCHHKQTPNYHAHKLRDNDKDIIDIFYLCSNLECLIPFIATYQTDHSYVDGYQFFLLKRISKGSPKPLNFTDIIHSVSSDFVDIYIQAHKAEEEGLNRICGVGYRKALEFLIKDFLIQANPDNEILIKKKFLGNCIKDHIDNAKLLKAVERAVWLGNDETHYTRKWIIKDLSDLKTLIKLTLHWIEMEKLTDSLDQEMPK